MQCITVITGVTGDSFYMKKSNLLARDELKKYREFATSAPEILPALCSSPECNEWIDAIDQERKLELEQLSEKISAERFRRELS